MDRRSLYLVTHLNAQHNRWFLARVKDARLYDFVVRNIEKSTCHRECSQTRQLS